MIGQITFKVMKFNLVTIFPDLVNNFIEHGLFAKAINNSLIEVKAWDPREFSGNKDGRIDDKPFGGGQGMLFQAEPIINTVNEIKKHNKTHVIFVAPHGTIFNQKKAIDLKAYENITIVCGRYEGIDKRIEETCIDEVISIGDYVLNGGELAALVLMEAIARQHKDFIGNKESLNDSFSDGLLEHPQYTRPEKTPHGNVPEILISGNHEKISRWKLKESLRITLKNRPDLIKSKDLSDLEIELLNEIKDE